MVTAVCCHLELVIDHAPFYWLGGLGLLDDPDWLLGDLGWGLNSQRVPGVLVSSFAVPPRL